MGSGLGPFTVLWNAPTNPVLAGSHHPVGYLNTVDSNKMECSSPEMCVSRPLPMKPSWTLCIRLANPDAQQLPHKTWKSGLCSSRPK
jgi:hypothetical protein